MARRPRSFDPRVIIAELEQNYVNYVLIGGLAQVLRGADRVTDSVDICPSLATDNLGRVGAAASELDPLRSDHPVIVLNDEVLAGEPVSLSTRAGTLRIVGCPVGAPKGFVDLRRAATKEHLGHGLQPLVASVGDLARMAAALHRDQDIARLPELRLMMELEADRRQTLTPSEPSRQPSRRPPQPRRRLTR